MTSSLFGNVDTPTALYNKEEQRAAQKRAQGPWLSAWSDPLASVHAFSSCMRVADISGDGEYKLLVAHAEKKLQIFKGNGKRSRHLVLVACTQHSKCKFACSKSMHLLLSSFAVRHYFMLLLTMSVNLYTRLFFFLL